MLLWTTRKNWFNLGSVPLLELDLGIFLKDSSMLQDTFSHSLAHISGTPNWIFMKIVPQMYLWTKKFGLNFGSRLDSRS